MKNFERNLERNSRLKYLRNIPKQLQVTLKFFLSSILIRLPRKSNNDPKANYWLVNVSAILNF